MTSKSETEDRAAWLGRHGYETIVFFFTCAMDNRGNARNAECASGYAVEYSGRLVRDDGSMAEYPAEGIESRFADTLPFARFIRDSRALITTGSTMRPYFVASYNPRETDLQKDQSVNPGLLPSVNLRELTPSVMGDGPRRFWDIFMRPAD